ncbi:chymotrypsinogen B-like [Ruditapes philippinarum]|uniref:chymotrypsinogen B-like n=1 Tax=Ruditapes philippinarum TaxID=129788 RepID=UPI00295B47CC|nr:chymotrypsinogen B-like [Ruditapes philippinarum]
MTSLYPFALFLTVFVVAEGNSLSRIIGGVNVQMRDHPWQASLQRSGSHICGASFIDNNWLVTAAHCVNNQNIGSLTIGYGHASRGSHRSATIQEIIMHPEYTEDGASGYPHDIALLRLASPVVFGSETNKIALPSEDINAPLDNCYITGWGCSSMILGICFTTPDLLQGTTISVLTKESCNSAWTSINILDVHVCVTESGKSGCSGDSGGPLSCQQYGTTVLGGATSWGSSTCSTTLPTVYTRVSEYVPWIRKTTGLQK